MKFMPGMSIAILLTGSIAASAKDYPFVGTWGEYFTNAPEGCADKTKLFEITKTHINGCVIRKIRQKKDHYIVSSRCDDGRTETDEIYLEDNVLYMISIGDPKIKATTFSYPRCS